MKSTLLDLFGRLLDRSGLAGWLARRDAGRAIALMYHGVSSERPDYYHWCQLPLARFRQQLDYLRRHHQVVSVERLMRGLSGEESLPAGAVVITFDDGYRNNYSRAFPELTKRWLPAVIYLATGCVDERRMPWPETVFTWLNGSPKSSIDLSDWGLGSLDLTDARSRWDAYVTIVEHLKGLPMARKDERLAILLDRCGEPARDDGWCADLEPMDWDQVREMAASGLISFGAHTVDHEILSRLPDQEVERQVGASLAAVAEQTGRPVSSFAYPNGRAGDFDERSFRALSSRGVTCAFATEHGSIRAGDAPLALRRIGVGADMPHGIFVLHCCGIIERLRGRRA